MKTVQVELRPALAAQQWEGIKALRVVLEESPIATPLGTFQFDVKSRQRMHAVVESLGEGWIEWLDVDNDPIELSPNDLRRHYYDLVERLGRRILALGAFTRELRQRLPLPPDDPVLRGEGWPT